MVSSLYVDLLLYLVVPVLLYVGVIFALHRKGWLGKDRPFGLLGPLLLWKTVHGRRLLDRLGRYRRFWNAFGDLGIILGLLGMVAMFAVLLWSAWRASSIPASAAPPLTEALVIPGLNPLVPIGYGLLALIVSVVLHEFSHGILARANDVRVKSLGVLFLVVPMGAFVEQDEEDLTQAPARKRDRIAAAGVMANFALALLFFLLLSGLLVTSVHVKANGVGVLSVLADTPAANTTVTMGSDGIAAGDLITAVNGTATPSIIDLESALHATHPGQTVQVQWYSQTRGGIVSSPVTLGEALHFPQYFSGSTELLRNTSILGVGETTLPPQTILDLLTKGPAATGTGAMINSNNDVFASSVLFIALPITNELPVQGTMAQFYSVGGPLGALGGNGANGWIVVNSLYWLVWMNLLLGIFNALPAVPLDGGFLFRDMASAVARRLRPAWTSAQLEGVVNAASIFATLVVFFLILWEVIIPHLP